MLRTDLDVSEGSKIWSSTPTPRSELKVSWKDKAADRISRDLDTSVVNSEYTNESVSLCAVFKTRSVSAHP